MAIIAGYGLDWKIIEEELRNQPNYWKWLPHYFRSLVELEEEYSIITPSKEKLEKEAEISRGIEVLSNRLEDQSLSLDEVAKILDVDDLTFSLTVLAKMKNLCLIKEEKGLYYLI